MRIQKIAIGMKICRWTVLKEAPSQLFRRGIGSMKNTSLRAWSCQCECGNIKDVLEGRLKSGGSASCGCYNKEIITKHGLSNSKFYLKWEGLQARCNNPKSDSYKRYGGRGIKCEWNSFNEFKDDMYTTYLENCDKYGEYNTTLDRIDTNGNYSKENCRWLDKIGQSNNTANNKLIEYKGRIQTMKMWTRELGLDYSVIAHRLNPKSGTKQWTVEEAFETPLLRNR